MRVVVDVVVKVDVFVAGDIVVIAFAIAAFASTATVVNCKCCCSSGSNRFFCHSYGDCFCS